MHNCYFCLVSQLCQMLWDPIVFSMPVLHHLLELAQTRPLSRWCHITISSSAVLFSSCLQSFPASGTFLMSQCFTLVDQSIGASASASVPPMNIQDWFPLGWTSLIYLQSKGLSRESSSTTVQKHYFFSIQPSLWPNSHPYVTTEKAIALTIQTFVGKVMSLLFNTLSRFVIAFLPRSKYLMNEHVYVCACMHAHIFCWCCLIKSCLTVLWPLDLR